MNYWWQDKPWRMIQTNLREIDMVDIDAERLVSDLQTFQATAVLFNCAGIIASYPTDLPFHFPSPYLQGDSLEEIIAACHTAGIRLLARTDFSKVRRPLYEQHPDWAYRTAAGEIVDYHGDVHACIMGDYQQVYALQIIEELLTRYDVDGIFFNMGGFVTHDYSGNYYGPCHCAACQAGFRAMFGEALPTHEDMSDPVYRHYRLFKERSTAVLDRRVRDLIHRLRPEIAVDRDVERGVGFIRQESNTAVDRPLPHWQYSASANTKWAVGSYPTMVSSNTSVDFIDFPYRHVAVSPHQQELRLAQSLANGGQLDWYLMGRLDNHEDRSGYEAVKRMFHYHAAHEQEYVGNTPLADVLLLNDSGVNDAECRGWYRVLTEGHWFFDAPLLATALTADWQPYRTVVLPNLRYLSDAVAAKLDDYVAAGGTLISVYESGLFTAEYERREVPALTCLGIDRVEHAAGSLRGAYFKLDDKSDLPRFADTDLAYLDGPYLYTRYRETVQQRLKLVPPHAFGPPERTYYTLLVDRPGFTVNRYGAGLAIHVPWLPGTLFHRQGHPNTANLMADLLEHVAGVERAEGTVPEQVEVTRLRNRAGFELVHLVNATGHYGNSFYAPLTLRDLELSFAWASAPTRVESLTSGEAIPAQFADGRLTLTIPRLGLFEAIKLTD